MSGKRKSPPNKFDADSNSSQGFEGGADADAGSQFKFQFNFKEIALSAAEVQQQVLNNNNNNKGNNNDCQFICHTAAAPAIGDENEAKNEELIRMSLGLGVAMVSASDGEHTDLDIDTRSMSPKTSSNESETDSLSQSGRQLLTIASSTSTKKRIKKSSKFRLLNGNLKGTPEQEQKMSGEAATLGKISMNKDAMSLYAMSRDDADIMCHRDEDEDINVQLFNSQYSAVINQEVIDKLQKPPSQLSTVVSENQLMEQDVIGLEQCIFHMPCRNAGPTNNNLDCNPIVSTTGAESSAKQSSSENANLSKPIRIFWRYFADLLCP